MDLFWASGEPGARPSADPTLQKLHADTELHIDLGVGVGDQEKGEIFYEGFL
jgi:hypothetical protein